MSEETTLPDDQPVPDPVGRVVDIAIEQELADSYLTYAMSTIVDRALPDVRDGLKPSQRRILVAMNDLNLGPNSKHRKCAKIAGDTSGNYHPHGEAVIYPTLVGMAQHWKMSVPLIDPQGNFGSIDPDPPAAMRYTEARMAAGASAMLEDLKLETVDWHENYDGTRDEPTVLPGKFPNLLINGGMGIAVGMATSIPPHNPVEIFTAVLAMLDNPDIELRELIEIIPGPDFPTGGIICGRAGIAEAYATGRGRVTVRGRVHQETTSTGREQLIVTQLPYQVTKNDGVINKISQAVKLGRITDIASVVDYSSNRTGMRVVIELKRGADPNVVENQLYQVTPLQTTVSIINTALVKGQPRTLSLRELLQHFIAHRVEVIRRRTAYRLRQAMQEAHRIEGLIYAVVDLDEVLKLIRSSRTRDEAIDKLMARGFRIPADHPYAPTIPERLKRASAENDVQLSRAQAEAIGRLQLIQLVGLEIEKLVSNYTALLTNIEDYEDILANMTRVYQIIRDETEEMRGKFNVKRRTEITESAGDLNIADLTPVEQVVVTATYSGYVKRLPVEQYRRQGRGGKGVIGADFKQNDFTNRMFVASTHDDLLCFTDTGRVFKMKVWEIPEAARTSRGRAIVNMLNLQEGERICELMPIEDFEREEAFLAFCTASGVVKRTALKDFRNVSRAGIIALNLRDGDSLIGVCWTSGEDHLLLGTALGQAIRFQEDDVRAMGRTATGVKGIDLANGDRVVALVRCLAVDNRELLTISEKGYGKRTNLSEYLVQPEEGEARPQSRGGKGRRNMLVNDRNGKVVNLLPIDMGDDIIVISTQGIIMRTTTNDIRQTARGSQGVRVIRLKGEDTVCSVARVAHEEDDALDGEGDEQMLAEGGAVGDACAPGEADEATAATDVEDRLDEGDDLADENDVDINEAGEADEDDENV